MPPFQAGGSLKRLKAKPAVFVFGSNLAGRHGAGAAYEAYTRHGAEWGHGEGRYGNSYAIPTKDWKLRTLPLDKIQRSVVRFLAYARAHPEECFLVTAVGTGLAGYKSSDIAPMFAGAPDNCLLPAGWSNERQGQHTPAISGAA